MRVNIEIRCEEHRFCLEKVAKVAMADLVGVSQPPEGYEDEYPFNALVWRRVFPEEYLEDIDAIISFVYCRETMPEEFV